MENAPEKPKRKLNFESYAVVVGFLCLEVLAFVSFYLGHSFILYGILSIVLALLLLLVTFKQINKDGIATYAFFLFPLFVFGLLTALSGFNYASIGAIGVAESVFVPITLTFFALSGFLSSYIAKFKIKYALLVIYIALGLFVLINSFITMIYYVPFYTIIYKNSYIFYEGKPSEVPIGSMAYMLFGFKVESVTLTYWTLFPSLLFTAVIPLFFIKPKENKREFIIYAVLSFIAFLSLLFTISRATLITDLILVLGIALIVVAAKIKNTRPTLNIMMMTLGIILLVLILIMFINAQTNWGFTSGIRNAIAGNSLMNRLFNTNRIATPIKTILQDLFTSYKLFGCVVGSYEFGTVQVVCDRWLFDNLMSSGLFGSLFFMAALVIGIRRLFKYLKEGKDEEYLRFLCAGFILGFLVMSLVCFDNTPLVNYSEKLFPFFTCAPLLIVVFLLSYSFNETLQLKEKPIEQQEEIKQEEREDEVITL